MHTSCLRVHDNYCYCYYNALSATLCNHLIIRPFNSAGHCVGTRRPSKATSPSWALSSGRCTTPSRASLSWKHRCTQEMWKWRIYIKVSFMSSDFNKFMSIFFLPFFICILVQPALYVLFLSFDKTKLYCSMPVLEKELINMVLFLLLTRLIKHTKQLLSENEERLCIKVLQTLREMMAKDHDYGEKVHTHAISG